MRPTVANALTSGRWRSDAANGQRFGIIFISAAIAITVSINWGAGMYPIYDETGVGNTILADGDIVHLVWDFDEDGIDPPGQDGLPHGGDQLLDTSSIGTGAFPNTGRFSDNTNSTLIGTGDRVYVRAWNADTLSTATHYGDSQLFTITSSLAFTLDCTASGSFATLIPHSPPCILGDVDCNCVVDVLDMGQVADSWQTSAGNPNYAANRDLNRDGTIDIIDVMIVTAHFGDTC